MRISIVTVTYNSEKTIKDTLDSVLRQNYEDYELLIVDGASTDKTIEIVKEYEPLFKGKLRWISEPDNGLYDAMNKGIYYAKGEIVGLLNSDDFYTSDDILSNVASRFDKKPNIDAVYGDVHYVKKDDTKVLVRYYSSRLFSRGWMRYGFMPAHPSFYCKKSAYEKFKMDHTTAKGFARTADCAYYDTSYIIAADFEALLRMIYLGHLKISYIHKDFVTMRTGGTSSSGALSHVQINSDHLRALKKNGIRSNLLLLSLRYIYKSVELFMGRVWQLFH